MNGHVANAALVVMSVLLVLAGLETALAVGVLESHPNQTWDVEYRIQPCENLEDKDTLKFHPEYGWTMRPGAVFYDKATPAQEWERHEFNDEGFRDVTGTGDQGVVVLGDSFTYGWIASNDETYPALLDQWNSNVSVHNYGISTYGPQQYYLLYEDKAREVDHDLVVVGYFLGNDINTMHPHPPARPAFSLSNGEVEQVHEPEPDLDFGNLPKNDAPVEKRLTVAIGLLDRINDLAAENDAQVLVVTFPRKKEVGSSTTPGWVTTQYEAIDRYAANETNVQTIHTKEALVRSREDRRVYGVYDNHPDDYGYYVVARTIQSWLVENDDRTGLDVTTDPGPPPDRGILAGVARHLWSTTESYGFLTRRGRLLDHRIERRLGLHGPRENLCE